jgi:hypothetical protein
MNPLLNVCLSLHRYLAKAYPHARSGRASGHAESGLLSRAERFSGHIVSPEYFSTLGVTPLGREGCHRPAVNARAATPRGPEGTPSGL